MTRMPPKPLDELPADGVHEVGLAHAHATVQEQRVIASRGMRGDGASGGVGELVAGAHHERLEGKLGVQGAGAGVHLSIHSSDGLIHLSAWAFPVDHLAHRQAQLFDGLADGRGELGFQELAGFFIGDGDEQGLAGHTGGRSAADPIVEILPTDLKLKITTDLIPEIHCIYTPRAHPFHRDFHSSVGQAALLFEVRLGEASGTRKPVASTLHRSKPKCSLAHRNRFPANL